MHELTPRQHKFSKKNCLEDDEINKGHKAYE